MPTVSETPEEGLYSYKYSFLKGGHYGFLKHDHYKIDTHFPACFQLEVSLGTWDRQSMRTRASQLTAVKKSKVNFDRIPTKTHRIA